jgi:hypothetical protein
LFAPVLLAALSAGCSIDVSGESVAVQEEKRFAAGADTEVEVRTFDGAIEVRSWDRNEVRVEITRRSGNRPDAEALEVRATQEGTRILVEAVNPSEASPVIRLGPASRSVSLIVTTPARLARLRARTGDGPVSARDVAADVALHTGDGPVRAERMVGPLSADTGDGDVSLLGVQGSIEAHSGDGVIEVAGLFDGLRVETGDGDIRIDARQGSVMKGDWVVTTGDGPISLRLPAEFHAELDAHTGDGPITAAGITTPQRDDGEASTLRATLGNGGAAIRLRTGDGPIAITR